MVTVLVDAENVRRSLWPNLGRLELVTRANAWGSREGRVVVFEGAQSAADKIIELASAHKGLLWVVISDRELRRCGAPYSGRIVGGGSFARTV